MRRFFCVSAIALLAIPAVRTAEAQVVVTGTVREFESGAPIPGAFVEILSPTNANQRLAGRVAAEDGSFTFDLDRKRAYRIRASRIGYRPATTVVLWRDHAESIAVEVRLATDAVVLAPVEVLARSEPRPSPVLDDFRARRAAGIGSFITREEIQRRSPLFITDMIGQSPGVRLESSGSGMRRMIFINRGTRTCPAEIYLDGQLLNRRSALTGRDLGYSLDDAVSPEEVEAVEIYSGIASIPAEFLSPRADCGVVAVWTARGDAR